MGSPVCIVNEAVSNQTNCNYQAARFAHLLEGSRHSTESGFSCVRTHLARVARVGCCNRDTMAGATESGKWGETDVLVGGPEGEEERSMGAIRGP